MRSLFRSKHKITQDFGVNPDYYKRFGLKAHEGLDLIPTGTVWDVLCLADGVVVKDEDNALSGAYGRNVTVWHPKLNKATQYCHLQENYVSLGTVVSEGDKLGLMGKTGNTSGAHVHLNLFETDASGIRQNRDNGFLGGVDPIPFLTDPIVDDALQKDLDTCRVDRDENHNDRMALYEELGFTGIFNRTIAVEKIRQLLALEKSYVQKDEQLGVANKQIDVLEQKIKELEENHASFAAESTKTIQDQGSAIQTLLGELQELKAHVELPVYKGWKDKLREILRIIGA
jgi:hypothetical protein